MVLQISGSLFHAACKRAHRAFLRCGPDTGIKRYTVNHFALVNQFQRICYALAYKCRRSDRSGLIRRSGSLIISHNYNIICNNSLVFCERTGQTVRRFAYDISNDGFAGRDVSILSASIFEYNSIVDWTYQQFPYSTLWCVMKDGTLASFEYMEEQDIMAWLTHRLGGDGKAICVATSYAVSPALDDIENVDEYEYATHEEIFAVVKRQGSLWLERMRPRTKTPTDNMAPCNDTLYHSLCLDGVRVLNALNGYVPTTETGAIWIPADTEDGAPITDRDAAVAKLASGVSTFRGAAFASCTPSEAR